MRPFRSSFEEYLNHKWTKNLYNWISGFVTLSVFALPSPLFRSTDLNEAVDIFSRMITLSYKIDISLIYKPTILFVVIMIAISNWMKKEKI